MDTFEIKNLSFSYPGQAEKALRGLDLRVSQGEFLVICGPSGCGKSTLLRQLKTALRPHGTLEGEILFEGSPLEEADARAQSAKIGFVLQNPENQIVTDKVWHELAFGLESLGHESAAIRSRVAEMASFFGIESWFHKDVSELSGGQKQLLNLASIMAMQPSVLILDEPTSQLDPIAAADFLAVIGRINLELGTTIILTEHRLEEVFHLATRLAVMDSGRILCTGSAREVCESLRGAGHSMFLAMPAPVRIWAAVENSLPCPISVRDGREWLEGYALSHEVSEKTERPATPHGALAVSASELWFKYGKGSPDVLRGLSLTAYRGELLAILGGNGVGKTTALSVLAGLERAYRGELEIHGSIGLLPQDPQCLFVKKTLREDLFEMLGGTELSDAERDKQVSRVVSLCRLTGLLDRHPYDLSGGEQQRAALAKLLLRGPDILLLDEPTKGLDAEYKSIFAQILMSLCRRRIAVIMVSHDIEFCAKYAGRCALFFDGGIVSEGGPQDFFSRNSFYTSSASRMSRGLISGAVSAEDIISACGGTPPPEPELPEDDAPLPPQAAAAPGAKPKALPLGRRILAGISGLAALVCLVIAFTSADLSELVSSGGLSAAGFERLPIYGAFIVSALVFALSVSRRSARAEVPAPSAERPRPGPRTTIAVIVSLLLIPLTIFIGYYFFEGRRYYVVFLLVMLEAMLPFVLAFEGRRPQARELVVIAVLCALGVAGRAAFFAVPSFSPVLAITIIAGVALGGETGFLVGAATMLLSNIMLGQGPWTPFQMFAMGLIGALAGLLFQRGLLRRTRLSLCVFGALSALIIYGGIMNPASALMWAQSLSLKLLLTYYISGLPMDLIHAASTVFFLLLAAEPMLEKLERTKAKFGLLRP